MSDDETTDEARRARADDATTPAPEPATFASAEPIDARPAPEPVATPPIAEDAADHAADAPPIEPSPIVDPPVAPATPPIDEAALRADAPVDAVEPAVVAAPIQPPDTSPPSGATLTPPGVVDDVPLAPAGPRAIVPQSRTFAEPGPLAEPAPLAATTVEAPRVAVVKPPRLASLDIFRGLTIAAMVLVNSPGSWGHIYAPLRHAAWHGWTFTDLVFPFFLFIVGCAIPFSHGKRLLADGATRATLLGHVWARALALVLLGILLGASNTPLPWADAPTGFGGTVAIRWLGFIFCYAALLALLTPWPWRRVATWLPVGVAVLLAVYLIVMHFVRAKAIANGWPADKFGGGGYNPDMLRLPGVLQRIGICYGVAATVALFAGRKTVVLVMLVLFVAYAALMLNGRIPGLATRSLEKDDNVARRIDVAVFERSTTDADGKKVYTQRHTYGEYPDPEGLLSTLPAIGTTLIGLLVGWRLRRADLLPAEKCGGLLARGVLVACAGVLLGWWLMPINKPLWTPSYAVLTAGLGMLALGAIYWIADVRGRRWFFWPLRVMGLNAIAAFVAAGLLVRIGRFFPVRDPLGGVERVAPDVWLRREIGLGFGHANDWLAQHAAGMPSLATPTNESLAYAICFLLLIWLFTLVLYCCRIFVKV